MIQNMPKAAQSMMTRDTMSAILFPNLAILLDHRPAGFNFVRPVAGHVRKIHDLHGGPRNTNPPRFTRNTIHMRWLMPQSVRMSSPTSSSSFSNVRTAHDALYMLVAMCLQPEKTSRPSKGGDARASGISATTTSYHSLGTSDQLKVKVSPVSCRGGAVGIESVIPTNEKQHTRGNNERAILVIRLRWLTRGFFAEMTLRFELEPKWLQIRNES